MSRGHTLLQQQADMVREILNRVDTISRNAAQQDDNGEWGLDGWIRVGHDLLDLQMRLYASIVQAVIAGPAMWLTPPASDPRPSEKVTVEAKQYPRKIELVCLRRVGQPSVAVPPTSIMFNPPVLQPKETLFEIVLTDDRFVGANYTGQVRLINTTDPTAKAPVQDITVGL
ncbi:hypothetical protein [Mycobacterium sp. IDR2000157661]|uniref:hypothetical protein n=1 Tax=Mycobacterium sp. IDR2000157661 TaxID=2867005 RepID=UPI001EEBB870|nr:hypothetical protein [Mycobacterium sp. IDR2000157661]ULE33793.1 hypothetical protein K3G64_03610 [Mycobacterium sp. IDR2000157661]